MAKKLPPKIITLDTETIGLDGPLKRVAIYDGQEVTRGYTFPDIEWKLNKIYDSGYLPHIYIHNADFDLRKMPEIFELGNVLWNTTKKISNRYARLVCKRYVIHDSIKIFPGALATLSKDFNLEHGKLDLWEAVQKTYPGEYADHVDFLSRCHPDDPLYLEYLDYDVISLYELLDKVMELAKLCVEDFVGILSTASLSRYLFKNGYGGEQFMEPGSDLTDFEVLTSCKAWSSPKKLRGQDITWSGLELKIREAYTGGRTEVFKPVCGEAWYYDVNSLYPSAMLGNPYPVGFPEYVDHPRIARNRFNQWKRDRRGLGFIKCAVYVPPQAIPPLPAKMGKLAFVTGHMVGTWTYIELEYAMENCGVEVTEWMEAIHFKKTFHVFDRFVGTMYELKEQATIDGNRSMRNFSKLIMNTSYGWTGMRRDDKTALREMRMLPKWEDSGRILHINEEMGYFEIQDQVMTDTVQVQIAAYVTSYARLVLLDAMRHMVDSGGEVYYCDTDSMVCSQPLPDHLVDSSRLGAWDLEHKLDSGIFLQPKVYMFRENGKETIKFKGITKARQRELDEGFYKDLLESLKAGEKKKIVVEAGRSSLPSLPVAQKRGKDPNVFNVLDKGLNLGAMQKRDIDYAGNTSKPWHMESREMFDTWGFESFQNPPESGKNLYGDNVMQEYTERDRELYEYLKTFQSEHGYSPTVREIGEDLYMSSTTVNRRLYKLVSLGYITMEPRKPRTIVLKV